jgi:hypothetical protein
MSPASAILEILLWPLLGGDEPKPAWLPSYADRADEVGSLLHRDGGRRKYLLETLGSGVALFDYDNDGWLDVYCVNGADLPGSSSPERPRNALFRGRGDGTFEDATARSGTGHTGYGFGCAAADYDGDGLVDLYVTNFADDVLYRNRGDGTFEDVTRRAGVSSPAWTTGAAFLDADGDGDLDLYVASYVEYAVTDSPDTCRLGNVLAYCHPKRYRGAPDILYRNNGDGKFTDVTTAAGIGRDEGKGLGVICGDYDNDGDQDISWPTTRRRTSSTRTREADGSARSPFPRESPTATKGKPRAEWASSSPTTTAMAGSISPSRTSRGSRTASIEITRPSTSANVPMPPGQARSRFPSWAGARASMISTTMGSETGSS